MAQSTHRSASLGSARVLPNRASPGTHDPLLRLLRPGPLAREWDRRMAAGILLASCGDAMGTPVDLDTVASIRRRHGQEGVTAPPRPGRISGVTQTLIATLDGLLRSSVNRTDPVAEIGLSMRWWAAGQAGEPADPRATGWLDRVPHMRTRRSGVSDLARRILALDEDPHAEHRQLTLPVLGACRPDPSALIRSVAIGSVVIPERAHVVAATSARYLGGDVLTAWCAGALAHGFALALAGEPLPVALRAGARIQPLSHRDQQRASSAITGAVALAVQSPGNTQLCQRLAVERTCEASLAAAVYAAVSSEAGGLNTPGWGMWLGVNHAGASALVGALTGALLGGSHSVSALNLRWLQRVELRFTLAQVITDVATACGAGASPALRSAYPSRAA